MYAIRANKDRSPEPTTKMDVNDHLRPLYNEYHCFCPTAATHTLTRTQLLTDVWPPTALEEHSTRHTRITLNSTIVGSSPRAWTVLPTTLPDIRARRARKLSVDDGRAAFNRQLLRQQVRGVCLFVTHLAAVRVTASSTRICHVIRRVVAPVGCSSPDDKRRAAVQEGRRSP